MRTATGRVATLALLALLATGLSAREARGQVARPQVMVVFVRAGCPHCARAEDYLVRLRAQRPDLVVVLREIGDPGALRALDSLSTAHNVRSPGVPTFLIGSELLVGFDAPATTGRKIEALLDRQKQAATGAGAANVPAKPAGADSAAGRVPR